MGQGWEMGFLEISHSSCCAAMGEKDKTGTLFCAYLNVNPKDQDNVPASSFHAEHQHNSNGSEASMTKFREGGASLNNHFPKSN